MCLLLCAAVPFCQSTVSSFQPLSRFVLRACISCRLELCNRRRYETSTYSWEAAVPDRSVLALALCVCVLCEWLGCAAGLRCVVAECLRRSGVRVVFCVDAYTRVQSSAVLQAGVQLGTVVVAECLRRSGVSVVFCVAAYTRVQICALLFCVDAYTRVQSSAVLQAGVQLGALGLMFFDSLCYFAAYLKRRRDSHTSTKMWREVILLLPLLTTFPSSFLTPPSSCSLLLPFPHCFPFRLVPVPLPHYFFFPFFSLQIPFLPFSSRGFSSSCFRFVSSRFFSLKFLSVFPPCLPF